MLVSLTFLFVFFSLSFFFWSLGVIFGLLEVVKSKCVAHLVQTNALFFNHKTSHIYTA